MNDFATAGPMRRRATALGCATLMLAACSSTPPLTLPDSGLPERYQATPDTPGIAWKPAQPAEAQPRGQWWHIFNDPDLNRLVEQAGTDSLSLEAAKARLRQVRAQAQIADARRSPELAVDGGVQRSRASPLPLGLPAATAIHPSTYWQAALSASYEVDLFGAVSANADAAHADLGASEARYRSVLLSLQAEVAQTYFRLRESKAAQRSLEEAQRLRERNVAINQRRFDLGDLGELDLARAKAELALTQADNAAARRNTSQLEHALSLLLGKPQEDLSGIAPLGRDENVPAVPAGVPSTLLERRPDIAAAQMALIGANARLGVVRSAIFPSLTLTANGGQLTNSFPRLFSAISENWAATALLSLPLIDGGRRNAAIAAGEADVDALKADYRQKVLAAFEEVQDNLSAIDTLAGQGEAVDRALAAARQSAVLAEKLYRQGESGYLDLIEAQRNVTVFELESFRLRAERELATVALIRAIGGQWEATL